MLVDLHVLASVCSGSCHCMWLGVKLTLELSLGSRAKTCEKPVQHELLLCH